MQAVVRRVVVLVGGVVGAAVGWALGTALAPDLADVTATAGAFAGVVVVGLAFAARDEVEAELVDADAESPPDPEEDG